MPGDLLKIRIYLEDTDAGGITYHASYLRFMERARTEWLRRTGLQQSDTFASDLSFVVHSMQLRFQRPARLDEEVLVSCEVARLGAASLVFQQQVRLANGGSPCVSADVTVACISLQSGRPRRIPAAIRERAVSEEATAQ